MRILYFYLAAIAGLQTAAAQEFEIDKRHSQVIFQVERFGFSKVTGVFSDIDGRIHLDQDQPAQSEVSALITTPILFTGDAERDGHVGGEFWLNTKAFPQISFESTEVELTGDNEARVSGLLTLLGESRPVTMDVMLNRMGVDPATKKQAVGFSASTRLKRSDFGLTTAMKLVGDEISITLEILAHENP